MNTKIAAIAMALVVTVCLVPAAADDSDADGTDTYRMGAYLFGGELTIPMDIGNYFEPESLFDDERIYLLEGSENYERMMEYIDDVTDDDPTNDRDVSITSDDRAIIPSHPGETMLICYTDNYEWYNWVYFLDQSTPTDLLAEPYGEATYTVKQGDTLTITIDRIEASFGDTNPHVAYWPSEYDSYNGKPVYVGQTQEIHAISTTSYVIGLDDGSAPLYYDVTVTVTGDSEPNGSATMFAAICFVIAALTIALLAYAAMKPKWAK